MITASTLSVGVNGACLYVTFSVLVPFGLFSHVMLINVISRLTNSLVCAVGAQIAPPEVVRCNSPLRNTPLFVAVINRKTFTFDCSARNKLQHILMQLKAMRSPSA